jgi:REP element-mobilizing transposase RayT
MGQHQFLDHVVRSREDYRLHIEYIHNNPIKHGLCVTNRKITGGQVIVIML